MQKINVFCENNKRRERRWGGKKEVLRFTKSILLGPSSYGGEGTGKRFKRDLSPGSLSRWVLQTIIKWKKEKKRE